MTEQQIKDKFEEWHNKQYGDYPDWEDGVSTLLFTAYQAAYAECNAEYEPVEFKKQTNKELFNIVDGKYENISALLPLFTRKAKS